MLVVQGISFCTTRWVYSDHLTEGLLLGSAAKLAPLCSTSAVSDQSGAAVGEHRPMAFSPSADTWMMARPVAFVSTRVSGGTHLARVNRDRLRPHSCCSKLSRNP